MPPRALAVLGLVTLAFGAEAAIVEIGPGADVRAAIAALQPGDELVLRHGVYSFSSRFNITVVGEADRPTVIRGKPGENVLIEMNTPNHNVLEVQGSQYLTLRNLRFRGGSHGIRLISSNHITIEGNEIFETGDVALSANAGGTYEGLVIRGNHIHHTNGTGEGMYLGCNNDACRVRNSVIEWNYIHHTNRATVEQGDGIELKEGSSGNVIRHNVIHDTKYPGILVYSTAGNGPPNVIEGNLIWNTADYGIQAAADAVIRNNIVLGSSIGLQPHQSGSPSNLTLTHNTLIGASIDVRGVSGPVTIANNAIYPGTGAAIRLISGMRNLVTLAGNVGTGGVSGGSGGFTIGNGLTGDFVNGHLNGAPPIDLFPSAGSALVGAGAAAHVAGLDFNGMPRDGAADAGAYRFQAGGNPGWTLAAGFKAPGSGIRPEAPANLHAN